MLFIITTSSSGHIILYTSQGSRGMVCVFETAATLLSTSDVFRIPSTTSVPAGSPPIPQRAQANCKQRINLCLKSGCEIG